MKIALYLIGSTLLASSVCFAEKEGKPKHPEGKGHGAMAEKIFAKLDTDSNATVSLEEFKASPRGQKKPENAEEIFKKIDADTSGGITLEEFKAAKPPQKKKGENVE